MSTTTTSTTTYLLVTYRYQQDKPGVVRPTGKIPSDEWKIYKSNMPTPLHLKLEITKTETGSYVSVVLSVVDTDETRPGGATVLETIDFLDFSGPEVAKISAPLKGVQNGKQVGFRYLHPLKAEASSQYHKRVQLTLTGSEEASALVNSIRHVCPIQKSSPQQVGNVHSTQKPNAVARAAVATDGNHSEPQNTMNFDSVSSANTYKTTNSSVDVQMHGSLRETLVTPDHTMFNSSPWNSRFDLPATPSKIQVDPKSTQALMLPPSQPTISQGHQAQQLPSSALPNSPPMTTPPSSSLFFDSSSAPTNPQQVALPDSPVGIPNGAPLSHFQASGMINGEVGIHELSAYELEAMAAQVIHEPGFTGLMEKLDAMYALKGFIKS